MRALPRWRQVSDDLLRRLRRGEFEPGFPGEVALAEEYGVSRGTVRQALAPLREQGIVSGAPGRQSQVINIGESRSFGPLYSLRDAVTSQGREEASEILARRSERNPLVAGALGLGVDTSFVYVARIRHADDVPIAADRIWVVESVARALLTADLAASSVYEVLRSECGVEFEAGVEYTRSEPAAADIAARLQVPSGSPLLVIRRKSCLKGQPVELRDTRAAGDRVTLTHVFGDASAVLACGGGDGRPLEIPWQ